MLGLGWLARRGGGIRWMLGLLLCATGVAFAHPQRFAVEHDCIAAGIQHRASVCAVSDLDGDRRADYAFSRDIAARSASISIYLSGEAAAHELLLPDDLAPARFIVRDVDGDGRPDIALLGGGNETLGVFLNQGSGLFELNREERYLSAPTRDRSEISVPAPAAGWDCAEPATTSATAVCDGASRSGAPSAGRISLLAHRLAPVRQLHGVARSRAP